jgi:SRSO17 transposase
MLKVFTFRDNITNKKKIITRNSQSSKYKLGSVITSFFAYSDWSVKKLKNRRLNKLKRALKGKAITVVVDETGDRKKGKKTDYVARQYLGSVGKIDNGIVSVNAYGVYDNITFPLSVKVFKSKGTLKEGDKYKTKIELASEIMERIN